MSFQPTISLNGIEEAIQGLGYRNESALKYRLVGAIRERYGTNGEFSEPVHGIDAEELICLLWSVEPDPDSLRSKKKNLSSIKSSVNSDLKRLYREGKNPEGITIGPENLFTISDEAKDDLLASIKTGGAAALQEIKNVAEILAAILSKDGIRGELHKEEMGSDLHRVGDLLKSLSEKMGLEDDAGPMQKGIEEFLKDAELKADESASSEPVEVLGEPEGEFPEAEPDDLSMEEDQPLDYVEIAIEDTADLTEVSEGEVYEPLEEVEEEESLEEVDDYEISELFSEGDLEEEGSDDLPEAIGTVEEAEQEEAADEPGEPLQIEEELEEVADETAEECEDSEDVLVEEGSGGGDSGEGLGDQGAAEEAVDELELEEDLGELEEEEAPEEEDSENVVVAAGLAEEGEGSEKEEVADDVVEALEVEEDLGEVEEETPEECDSEDVLVAAGLAEEGEGSEKEEVADDVVEALEVEDDLGEVEAEEAPEEEDSEDVLVAEGAGEEGGGSEKEEVADDVVEALEVEDDLGEVEAEETPEEYDDSDEIVLDAGVDESGLLDEEEEGVGGEMQSAPVQGMSVGDETGGTEIAEEGARVLAEKFNSSLSEMDRFYNQYLFVPAGEYTIGSPDPREKGNPARRVQITEFYIGKFPITNALFDVFVEKTGYTTTAERVGYGIVYYGRLQRKRNTKTGRETVVWNTSLTSKIVQGAYWYQPSGPGSNLHHKRNHPVVQVSLEDAIAFASWTGKRLPTEEEWEAASRTMKGGLYPWGNRPRKDACNMEKSGHGDTSPVDQFVKFANEYGIADTMGNVLEWTTTKTDARVENDRAMVCFIAKGGSWITARPLTLAGREEFGPELHSNVLGFRCVAY